MLASCVSSGPTRLDWLVGCWVAEDTTSQEVWVVDSRGSLIGFNVVLRAGKVDFFEVLSIEQNTDGILTYTAHPSGQAPASFIEIEASENSVVFANPNHDYPQKISYRRDDSHLAATISLSDGSNSNSFEKVACS